MPARKNHPDPDAVPPSRRKPQPKEERQSGQIIAIIPHEWEAYIVQRAEAIQWSPSKFMKHVVRSWLAQGAPAVHPTDLPIDPVPDYEA